MFWGSRYDKGDPDFLNIPLSNQEYETLIEALISAEKLPYNDLEKPRFFERCMPIEELAKRGIETLAFGPMRPVGFVWQGRRPRAVLQLRSENSEKSAFNLVGCQTRMKQGEQKRVFSLLPGFENAEFLRYGSVHRNSFINAPELLSFDFALKSDPSVLVAGQLSGVEGYVESILSGMFSAFSIISRNNDVEFILPETGTMSGGIFQKLLDSTPNFQPVNANFALIFIPTKLKRREKKLFYVEQGKRNFLEYWNKLTEMLSCLIRD